MAVVIGEIVTETVRQPRSAAATAAAERARPEHRPRRRRTACRGAGAGDAAPGVGPMNLTATQLTKLTIDAYADIKFEKPAGIQLAGAAQPDRAVLLAQEHTTRRPSRPGRPRRSSPTPAASQTRCSSTCCSTAPASSASPAASASRLDELLELTELPRRHAPAVLRARLLGPVQLPRDPHPGRRHLQALRPVGRAAAGDGQADAQGGALPRGGGGQERALLPRPVPDLAGKDGETARRDRRRRCTATRRSGVRWPPANRLANPRGAGRPARC